MQALLPRRERQSLIDAVVQWWRKLDRAQAYGRESSIPRGDDMGQLAFDLQAAAEFRALVSQGPDEAYLLPRRMAVLGLSPDEIARLEPCVFCELQWRCTLCEEQGRCAGDLADDFADPVWQDWHDEWDTYCPNAVTLRALGELPWFRPASS
jgi:hypothetical protein